MTTLWLINPSAFEAFERAHSQIHSAADIATFEASSGRGAGSEPKNYALRGDVAHISVTGALTKAPDFWAWLLGMGNTTYSDIVSSLALADSDVRANSIEMFVESPGGQVDGLFEAISAIRTTKKPIKVRSSRAESAAYALAAAAGQIEAVSPASMFGSVGVVASFRPQADVIDVTSTEAPDKRPDVRTEAGRAVVVAQLDAVHDLFADVIAKGRGVDVKAVNAEFGRGASYLAAEAASRGMIDSVVSMPRPRSKVAAESGGAEEGNDHMDLKTLKAQHPELCEALRVEGRTEERDRVSAHLILAEGSGDTKSAIEAIKAGEGITETVKAKHLSAAMKSNAQSAAQSDASAAASAVDGAKPVNNNPAAANDAAFIAAYAEFSKEA